MASTKPKFWLATSGILGLSTAVFILLSVVPADALQCYWCGPLAEQVHRSQRAPSCDAALDQVTACEAGLTHCAVVATYPPYIESRYCVKLYQDECYSLFCNSTKTWRMTCPCRGDLCNGPNTDREIKAFATLTDLVYKSQSRVKRTMISSPKFISGRRNKSKNITDSKPEEIDMVVSEEMQSDQADNNILNDNNNDNPKNVDDEKVQSTTTVDPVKVDKQDDISNDNEGNQIDFQITTPVSVQEMKVEDNAEMKIQNVTNLENEEIKINTEIQILNSTLDTFKELKNEEKTEIYILITTPSTVKIMKDEINTEINARNATPEILKDINDVEMKNNNMKANKNEKPAMGQVTKEHNENLPTAEALQNTASQIEKATEGTTVASTSMTTHVPKINITLNTTLPGKNNSEREQKLSVLTQIIIFLILVFI